MSILIKQSLRKPGNIPHPHNLNRIGKASKKIRQRRARYGPEEHTPTDFDKSTTKTLPLLHKGERHMETKSAHKNAHTESICTRNISMQKATSDFKKFQPIVRSMRHEFFFAPILATNGCDFSSFDIRTTRPQRTISEPCACTVCLCAA